MNPPSPISAMKAIPPGLFGIVFLVAGLFFTTVTTRQALQQCQMASWPAVPCVIESADVANRANDYALTVRYRYIIDGATYTSDQYDTTREHTFKSVSQRQPLLDRYAAGAAGTCYVNPADPAQAVLSNTYSPLVAFGLIAFTLIFVAIGTGIFLSAVYGLASHPPSQKAAAPREQAPRPPSTRLNTLIPILFSAIFIITGLAIAAFTVTGPLRLIRQARDWQSTKAIVTHSDVRSHRSSGRNSSTTYSVYIAYRYTVNGQTYESDRGSFSQSSSSGRQAKADIAARHPAGSEIDIFFDPADPQSSVINRGASMGLYLGILFPVIFTLVGLFVLIVTLRLQSVRRPTSRSQASYPPSNIRAYTRTDTRIGRLFATLFFALFWNGIVSVFLFQTVQGWLRGQRPVFESLFLVPFVLVGAAFILAIFHALLRFFTPRVELAPFVPLAYGSSTSVSYTITGNLARLTKLTVTLTRNVTTGSGKSAHTKVDKTILLEIDAPLIPETGLVSVSIPAKSALPESPDDYDTVWKLTFRGAIPFWPDMSETFTLNIHDSSAT